MGLFELERCARNREEVLVAGLEADSNPCPHIVFFQHLFQLRTQFFSSSNINSERPQNMTNPISQALAL